MIAGQSTKKRTVVKKCHVLVTMQSDSVQLLPLLDGANSQTFNKVYYTPACWWYLGTDTGSISTPGEGLRAGRQLQGHGGEWRSELTQQGNLEPALARKVSA